MIIRMTIQKFPSVNIFIKDLIDAIIIEILREYNLHLIIYGYIYNSQIISLIIQILLIHKLLMIITLFSNNTNIIFIN